MSVQCVIGLDVGGTTVRGVFYDLSEQAIEASIEQPTATDSLSSFLGQIELLVASLQKEADKDAEAIGVGLPSFLDRERKRVLGSTNFDLLADIALTTTLSDRLGLPVRMENDANCAALAEALLGAGRGKGVVVALTLGTGIGSGIIVNGAIFTGAHGGAGEIGYVMTPELEEDISEDGHPSTLEWHTSGKFLKHVFKGKDPAIVEQEARKGDREALRAYEIVGSYVGVAVGAIANIVDPDVVAIAGGIGHAWDLMEESTFNILQKLIGSPAVRDGIIVSPASFGVDAGAIGASLLWYN